MRSRTLHVLLGAVIAATFAGISTVAQAKVYPIAFDPQFDGTVLIDIDENTCTGTGSFPCQVDLVLADVFDVNFPTIHWTGGPTSNVGDQVLLAAGVPVLFQSVLPEIVVEHTSGCPDECFTKFGLLEFFIGFNADKVAFPGAARLTFANDQRELFSDYIIGPAISVPEPGTLGLLLGAFGAGWLAKRRKFAA